MAPFYGWGSTVSRLEPLRGGSLLILRLTIFCIFQNSCMEWNICRKCTVTWCQRFPFNQVGKMESSQKNGKEVRSFLFFVKKQLKSKQYRDGYYWVQCAETKELPFHLILHIFNFVRLNSTWGITQTWKLDIHETSSVIKPRGRISKRVLQENKARQIFRKTNISFPNTHMHVCISGEEMFVFRKMLHVWFLETPVLRSPPPPLVLLATIYTLKLMLILN